MTLALYTTVYPAVEPWLPSWYASVRAQTDSRFDVWIGADGVAESRLMRLFGATARVTLVPSPAGATPAVTRAAALGELVATDRYDGVVLADSDDILLPRRISAARLALADVDLSGCAMVLATETGTALDARIDLRAGEAPDAPLPAVNVYGFSNTAYRTEWIARLLPPPDSCVALDWLWATRLWLRGGRLAFDREPGMWYRQHANNVDRLTPPFNRDQVRRTTDLVCRHYQLLAAYADEAMPERWSQVEHSARRAHRFAAAITDAPLLDRYVSCLTALGAQPVWWAAVAHPGLEDIWNIA